MPCQVASVEAACVGLVASDDNSICLMIWQAISMLLRLDPPSHAFYLQKDILLFKAGQGLLRPIKLQEILLY